MYIDARGNACPLPVIKAKKALQGALDPVTVAVDNAIAVENLEKMAAEMGHRSESRQRAERHFEVVIVPKDSSRAPEFSHPPQLDTVLLITSRALGSGEDTLGEALMKAFLYTVSESEDIPGAVILMNGGARLSCEGSASLADLEVLARKGARIYTCGACLNFYGIADALKVGEVSNMYEIYEKLGKAAKVLRP